MIKLQSNLDSVDDYSLRTIAPDLTPLIDIIFILIVFLILTSNPAIVELMVDIPKKHEEKLQQYVENSNSDLLKIKPNGEFYFNEEKISDISLLKEALSQIEDGKELVIAGDKKVDLETFLRVMAILKGLKIKNTKILMGDLAN